MIQTKFLRTSEKDIIDAKGNPILLCSINLGNWLLTEGYMWKFSKKTENPREIEQLIINLIGEEKAIEFWKQYYEHYITEQDIQKIAEIGFNSIRLPINYRMFMNNTSTFQGFYYIDHLINWCKKHSLYIILDLHAAPGGQTGTNIDDSENKKPELFIHERNKEKTIRLWQKIAKKYKDEEIIAAYDLLNEPLPEGEFSCYNKDLFPLYNKITQGIREYDKNHMICLEGANWATDWSVLGKPFDDNIFYQFHKYWNETDQNSIQPYLDAREKWNIPIWVGETGENTNQWYEKAYKLLKDNNIGWAFWPWKKINADNCCISIKAPDNWNKIITYSDKGEKPDQKEACKILWQLLENIKLKNCKFFPDIAKAVLGDGSLIL